MTPRIPARTNAGGRARRVDRPPLADAAARLERSESELRDVRVRLDRVEARLPLLENTLHAVAQRTGVSVAGPCGRCELSLLLVTDAGMLLCPKCGYQQSI